MFIHAFWVLVRASQWEQKGCGFWRGSSFLGEFITERAGLGAFSALHSILLTFGMAWFMFWTSLIVDHAVRTPLQSDPCTNKQAKLWKFLGRKTGLSFSGPQPSTATMGRDFILPRLAMEEKTQPHSGHCTDEVFDDSFLVMCTSSYDVCLYS